MINSYDIAITLQKFWLFLAISARVYGVLFILPLFNSTYISRILRSTMVFIFAGIALPIMSADYVMPLGTAGNIIILVKEFAYGFSLGYVLCAPFWLISSIGSLIDMQRGEQMGAIINHMTNSPDSSVGKLISQAFITFYIAQNGLLFVIDTLFNSFKIVPINQFIPDFSNGANVYVDFLSNYFYWVIILALPVIFCMFLADVVLGLISMFVPQLNVTVIAMPIKSAIALFLLVFYVEFIYHDIFIHFLYSRVLK